MAPVACEGPWGHCVVAPIGPFTLLMIEPRQRNRKSWQFHWWNYLANISSHTLEIFHQWIKLPYILYMGWKPVPTISSPHQWNSLLNTIKKPTLCYILSWTSSNNLAIAAIGFLTLLMNKRHPRNRKLWLFHCWNSPTNNTKKAHPMLCTRK